MKILLKLLLLLTSQATLAQESEFEIKGVFGECYRHYSSKNESLKLHNKPNKSSKIQIISYGKDWEIPYKGGVTRVITSGKLIALQEHKLAYCIPALKTDDRKITKGEKVKYLYYTGEGYGIVLFKGSKCNAPVYEGFNVFENILYPEVQAWIKVLYKDKSSPGWLLLNDGSQYKIGKVDC